MTTIFDVQSLPLADYSSIVDIIDESFNGKIIGRGDPIFSPKESPKEIYITQHPYNYYVEVTDGDQSYSKNVIKRWNATTSDYVNYASAEQNQCQPITVEGMINNPEMVMKLLSANLDLEFDGNFYADNLLEGLPTPNQYMQQRQQLSDDIIRKINEAVIDDIITLFEYNLKEVANEST